MWPSPHTLPSPVLASACGERGGIFLSSTYSPTGASHDSCHSNKNMNTLPSIVSEWYGSISHTVPNGIKLYRATADISLDSHDILSRGNHFVVGGEPHPHSTLVFETLHSVVPRCPRWGPPTPPVSRRLGGAGDMPGRCLEGSAGGGGGSPRGLPPPSSYVVRPF